MAEQKGEQGDLIDDTGGDLDTDSGVVELADDADDTNNDDPTANPQNNFNQNMMWVLLKFIFQVYWFNRRVLYNLKKSRTSLQTGSEF